MATFLGGGAVTVAALLIAWGTKGTHLLDHLGAPFMSEQWSPKGREARLPRSEYMFQ